MLISGKGAAGGLGSSEEAVVRVSHPSHLPGVLSEGRVPLFGSPGAGWGRTCRGRLAPSPCGFQQVKRGQSGSWELL